MRFLLRSLSICAGVSILVFFALRAVPGDPVDLLVGESELPARKAELRTQLGLEDSLASQLKHYYGGLVRGDLGRSISQPKKVSELIAERIPYTALLTLAAAALANLIGVPLGVYCAYRPRSYWSRGIHTAALILISLPTFWLGPLLILALCLNWPWLPFSGAREAGSIFLPALTLGLGMAAVLFQATRAATQEVLGKDYFRTALAKGASPARALFRHALPNAALPVLTISGLQLGHLLAGAVITEGIFAWPGIGSLAFEAIQSRDYPTVQGIVLCIALTYAIVNTATDAAGIQLRAGRVRP